MRTWFLALAAVLAISIAACGRSVSMVEGVGDAENSVFSEDGRLFVTGGENIYEILASGTGFAARPVYQGACNFTGVVVRGGYLYTSCVDDSSGEDIPYLLAAELTDAPDLAIIHRYEQAAVPNGMAFDPDGRLFVADSTPLQGKIVVLSIDPADPLRVAGEATWLTGFIFVNGMRYRAGELYVTDLNAIKTIPIGSDGSAGDPTTVSVALAIFDDLLPTSGGILVTDFLGGRVVAYSHSGRRIMRTAPVFESPSSIMAGRPPLVPEGTLVVTEKGTIGDLTSDLGNRVSLFTPER